MADTGPGILPEQLPHVFGRFWQAQGADQRGIGLGLAPAKVRVEQRGGEIRAGSPGRRGARFHFTLPCVEVLERASDGPSEALHTPKQP